MTTKMVIDYASLSALDKLIEEWAIERDLHKVNPDRQVIKLMEEVGELSSSFVRNDSQGVADAIGDIFVVIKILSLKLDLDFEDLVQDVYNEIKDRKGKIVNGTFIKDSDLNG